IERRFHECGDRDRRQQHLGIGRLPAKLEASGSVAGCAIAVPPGESDPRADLEYRGGIESALLAEPLSAAEGRLPLAGEVELLELVDLEPAHVPAHAIPTAEPRPRGAHLAGPGQIARVLEHRPKVSITADGFKRVPRGGDRDRLLQVPDPCLSVAEVEPRRPG